MGPASALYRIRIKGYLGATLLSAFPAMTWQRHGSETVLTALLDQPALYGALAEIEALGLDLLEVRQLTPEASASASTVGLTRDDGGGQVRHGKGRGMVTQDPSRAAWLRHARSRLHGADPVLARLIDDRPDFDPRAWMTELPPMDLYGALLFQVAGQQLSVAATRRTLARIEALFGGRLPSPAELLSVDPGRLRDAGLSWRKISTLRDLAGRLSDGRLNPDALPLLPDDELMAELTVVPGIGPWTVQGALIIALGREDVVLPGDLALRRAVQAAYQLNHLPAPEEVLAIADKWRPYRSLATSYLFSAAFEQARARPVAPGEA
jgi:DNA-3-methyladenine glycosylase II